MNDTKKKAKSNKDAVYAQGRLWSKESFESYRKYQNQYNKEHYRQIVIRLNNETDKELIDWLSSQENLAGYIKQIAREDMEKKKSQL